MYFINDEAGVAYETTEGGIALWVAKDDDFTALANAEDIDSISGYSDRRVSCDEAKAFARSKASASGALAPRE